MRIFFVAVATLWGMSFNAVYSQTPIRGVVRDAESGRPLGKTAVFIPQLQRGAESDSNGVYEFDNLPSAAFSFQFTHNGYHSYIQKVNVAEKEVPEVKMVRSYTELEEVVVTANQSKLPQQYSAAINSIPMEELQKHNAPTLLGNLSYEPGIDRISTGTGIGKPVIRGLSFNRILLYAQGTRIENQQWDDRHDLGLTEMGVRNIEIVRGPAAVVYGADALGGAIVFSGEKPLPAGVTAGDAGMSFFSNTLGINGDAGIRGTNKNGFFYGVRIGGASHTSYLQGEQKGDATIEKEAFAPNSKFLYGNGKVDMGWSKKWGVSKISYSYLRQLTGIIEDESGQPGAGNDEAEQRERELEAPYQDVATNILSSENTIITGASKLNINLAWQSNNRKEFEPLPEKQKELAYGLSLNAATFDVRWTSDELKNRGITIGTQGLIMKSENTGIESLVPDAKVNNFGLYGLYRYDAGKLNLQMGARIDQRGIEAETYEPAGKPETDSFIYYNRNDTIQRPELELEKEYRPVSFSAGAAYHLTAETTIKANVSSGFTAPNYAQLGAFGKHEGAYRFEVGNKRLNIEENIQADLGIIREGDIVSLEAGLYQNYIKNYIYLANTGDSIVQITSAGRDTLPAYEYRQGGALLQGGEISLDFHPPQLKWLDIKVSYALVDARLKDRSPLPFIPSNKLTGVLRCSKEKLGRFAETGISLVVSSFQQRTKVAEYEQSSKGYTLFDLYADGVCKIGSQPFNIGVFCTNLLNTGYYSQLSLVKYIGVQDMGRNIGVRLRVPFGIKH